MTPPRAVFLDIGDTVLRANPSWEGVYTLALEEYGISVPSEALRDALRSTYHHGRYGLEEGFEATPETSFRRTVEMDQAALDQLGVGPMSEEFFRRLSELFMLVSSWHVFPDVMPALDELRARGLIIGAVSNWIWQLPELLHSLELLAHFDFVAASARVGYEKPQRGIFEHALQEAKVRPEEAIHVGDHIDADVQGAMAVGIAPVLIDRRERFTEADLPAGVPLIRSLTELAPLVDARLQRASA
ncbi:MAG TPA: HAD-IA family hydrolase [Candidatus Limnocylindria bacterium]